MSLGGVDLVSVTWIREEKAGFVTNRGSFFRTIMIATAVFLGLFFCSPSFAGCSGGSPTWTAASANQSDVQACVNAASNGDTVLVPSGNVSYSTAVDIPVTKCVTINGQGGVTITSTLGFTMETGTSCESRITGFAFTGASGNAPSTNILVTLQTGSFTGRIDHNTFNHSGTMIFIQINNADGNPFLIDHNTFTMGSASECIHVLGANSGDNTGWQNDVTPGGPNMVFVEDNTFNNTQTSGALCSLIESYYGAQTVIRYNTSNFCQIDQHGTAGYVGARWWEAYDNTFIPTGAQCCFITMRGGSGVIFNNHLSGSNPAGTPSNMIDLYYEPLGSFDWPGAWQVGSGINGFTEGHTACSGSNSAPAYIWGNDSTMTIGSQTSSYVALNRDYFVSSSKPSSMNWMERSGDTCSTTYAYTPYTYPHPLQGTQSTQVAPPSGLTATVQE